MRLSKVGTFTGLIAVMTLAGCSNSPSTGLTTASVKRPVAVAQPAVNPACTTLASQISAARQEGTPAKIETISKGKTRSAVVKRAALARVAKLDRLNSEFQAKCTKYPGTQTAAVVPPKTAQPKASTSSVVKAAQKAQDTIAAAKAAQLAKNLEKSKGVSAKPIVAVPKK